METLWKLRHNAEAVYVRAHPSTDHLTTMFVLEDTLSALILVFLALALRVNVDFAYSDDDSVGITCHVLEIDETLAS